MSAISGSGTGPCSPNPCACDSGDPAPMKTACPPPTAMASAADPGASVLSALAFSIARESQAASTRRARSRSANKISSVNWVTASFKIRDGEGCQLARMQTLLLVPTLEYGPWFTSRSTKRERTRAAQEARSATLVLVDPPVSGHEGRSHYALIRNWTPATATIERDLYLMLYTDVNQRNEKNLSVRLVRTSSRYGENGLSSSWRSRMISGE